MRSACTSALFSTLALALLAIDAPSTFAHVALSVAGPNWIDKDPSSSFRFSWTSTDHEPGHWLLQDLPRPITLIADPDASPMSNLFMSPRDSSGDSFFELFLPDWKGTARQQFLISTGGSPQTPFPASPAISGWHTHIREPGWEWGVWADHSLLTVDGNSWDWAFADTGEKTNSNEWSIEFPPIHPGAIVSIHNELIWKGTPENTIWGDNLLDNGLRYRESFIEVWEYPVAVPEPTSAILIAIGTLSIFFWGNRTHGNAGSRSTTV